MPLNLLHLSDIHFKYEIDGTIHDLDHDVRNELAIDIARVSRRTGPIDAIVVTGDIAFSGKAEDYEVARIWLASLCDVVGCKAEHVWVVPGNHDVDWTRVTTVVRNAQDAIQDAPLRELDNRVKEFIHDDKFGAAVLAAPFEEYQKFAAIYGCKPPDGHLAWQADLILDAGYRLRLVGLNSAFVSNNCDDENHRPLVVGQAQLDMPRASGRLYLTLCHHPASWLKDAASVSSKLAKRALIQLFGHVHEKAFTQTDQAIVVQAGALQPDRSEDPWYPTYNVVRVKIVDFEQQDAVAVSVYPRVWSEYRFCADPECGAHERLEYLLPIDDAISLRAARDPARGEPPVEDRHREELNYSMADPVKQLVYGFLTLPYSLQIRIATRLELLRDEDAGLDTAELFERIYTRARDQGRLAILWALVSAAQETIDMNVNPYGTPTE